MDYNVIGSEFFRPLVNAWLGKIEASARGRKRWKEIAYECMMFYSSSARAMWDPAYSKKFWKGVKLPKFRITINKAFEMVAIYGPNLFWEVPHRNVEAKRDRRDIPLSAYQMMFQEQAAQQTQLYASLGIDPEQQQQIQQQLVQQQMQQLEQSNAQMQTRDDAVAALMGSWLNYTPNEQPGGGLSGHGFRATIDALITGRGCLAPRPYRMPGSGRTLTGAFRVSPFDVYLDPDFDSVDECRWMAIRHVDVNTEVEKRFNLPANSQKNRETLESSWTFNEMSTDDQAAAHRKSGRTNDLVVWYEIYSKSGCGCVGTAMDPTLRQHLDKTVGQHVYLAICGDVTWPLNMPSERIRNGISDEEVRDAFSWPVPLWADDRWPVEFLDFYEDPQDGWPVAPLAPGLGELKLLNFLVSWFANRTWSSTRDFWAVASPYIEHYKEYINDGEDQQIIPTPVGLKTPREAIEILTQPEARQDMTNLISFVSDMFDRRVGMTATIYGQNEGQTQNRTAEETIAKQRAVMARPEFMAKQVVDWQSRVASSEAFVTRRFVKGQDVAQHLGPYAASLWQRFVESEDVEVITRQFQYSISAASIRRPNRERDIANYQQVVSLWLPAIQEHAARTGNYSSFNATMGEWARLHDANLDQLMLPIPNPEEQQENEQKQDIAWQLEIQEKQAEVQKTQAEAQKILGEAQAIPAELEAELRQQDQQMALEQVRQQTEQIRQQGEINRQSVEMQNRTQQAGIELLQDAARHEQNMQQDQEKHEQNLEQKRQVAAVKAQQALAPSIIQGQQ